MEADEAIVELEGKSKYDGAWYDCELAILEDDDAARLQVHFVGFGTEEDEYIENVDDTFTYLRTRSIALDNEDCQKVTAGQIALTLQKGRKETKYFDATIEKILRRPHTTKKCKCVFEMRWLASGHVGKKALLKFDSLCRLTHGDIKKNNVVEKWLSHKCNDLPPSTSLGSFTHAPNAGGEDNAAEGYAPGADREGFVASEEVSPLTTGAQPKGVCLEDIHDLRSSPEIGSMVEEIPAVTFRNSGEDRAASHPAAISAPYEHPCSDDPHVVVNDYDNHQSPSAKPADVTDLHAAEEQTAVAAVGSGDQSASEEPVVQEPVYDVINSTSCVFCGEKNPAIPMVRLKVDSAGIDPGKLGFEGQQCLSCFSSRRKVYLNPRSFRLCALSVDEAMSVLSIFKQLENLPVASEPVHSGASVKRTEKDNIVAGLFDPTPIPARKFGTEPQQGADSPAAKADIPAVPLLEEYASTAASTAIALSPPPPDALLVENVVEGGLASEKRPVPENGVSSAPQSRRQRLGLLEVRKSLSAMISGIMNDQA